MGYFLKLNENLIYLLKVLIWALCCRLGKGVVDNYDIDSKIGMIKFIYCNTQMKPAI